MKLSDLQGAIGRVIQLAGDVEVVLKSAETEAETVVTGLVLRLDPAAGTAAGTVAIEHGPPPPPPAADPPAGAPEGDAPAQ